MTTKEESREILLQLCPPGTDVYLVLEHVSSSGMTRWIKAYVIENDHPDKPVVRWLSGYIHNLHGTKRHKTYDGNRLDGCGMDMGFSLVCDLSSELHGDGYALNHRWL